MIYYCFTKDCLREYVLRYFGQVSESFCDNCINCHTEFDEMDVTEVSKDIIGCVRECGQRFGINVIVTALMGKNTTKLNVNQMVNNSFYGKCSSFGESFIKQVANKLIIEGYLYLTNDKYSIVKVDRSALSIESNKTKILLKVSKESRDNSPAKTNKTLQKSEILTSRGLELFDVLRQVRTRLAREEGMPPYIIFSDKTLTDMVVRLPMDKDEMLHVSGVGLNKYEKYGQFFLDAILDFTHGNREKLCYEQILEAASEKMKKVASNKGSSSKVKKNEFYLTENIKQNLILSETYTISQFVEQLNQLRDEQTMKVLGTKYLTAKLKEMDYLIERYDETLGKNVTKVTEKGYSIGIFTEMRTSANGSEYEVVIYNEKAQRFLLTLLPFV